MMMIHRAWRQSISTLGRANLLSGHVCNLYAVSRPSLFHIHDQIQTILSHQCIFLSTSTSVDVPKEGNASASVAEGEDTGLATYLTGRQDGNLTGKRSRYLGVSWNKRGKKWISRLVIDKRCVFARSFASEEEAARAFDGAVREHQEQLPLNTMTNFDSKGIFLDPKGMLTTKSKEATPSGIGFLKSSNQWKAAIRIKGRLILLGLFDTQKEASRAFSKARAAIKGGQKVAPRQSKYIGVYWHQRLGKWRTMLRVEGKQVLEALFPESFEEAAAHCYDEAVRTYCPGGLTNFDDRGQFLDPKKMIARVGRLNNDVADLEKVAQLAGVDFCGVTWDKQRQRWKAQIMVAGRRLTLGYFESARKAAIEYDKAAREYHKERAKCNFDHKGHRTTWRVRVFNSRDAPKKYIISKMTDPPSVR